MLKNIFIIFLVLIIGLHLATGKIKEQQKRELIEQDQAFYKLVQDQGMIKAYLKTMDRRAIVIPREGYPIVGIRQFRWQSYDHREEAREIGLTWSITDAGISQANDLGYTVGLYSVKKSGLIEDYSGYYASVWKKDAGGDWRLAFSQGLLPLRMNNPKPLNLILNVGADQAKRALIATELAFARYALDHGIPKAFHRFIATNGIAVGSNGQAQNKEIYANLVSQSKSSSALLSWEPVFSGISKSGDLGYNTGPYKYILYPEGKMKQVVEGYFFTIWIKENGSWKFIYDGGNQISDH